MDVFTKEKRSEIMSKIRAKNTKAERIVFRYLRSHKVYFQRHYRGVPGCPDIALPRKKIAVFIDGDFWHEGISLSGKPDCLIIGRRRYSGICGATGKTGERLFGKDGGFCGYGRRI